MDPESRAGFPATHTTTTTTTSTSVITSLRLDPAYVRGLPGTLKCAQMVTNKNSLNSLLEFYSNHSYIL